jgi:nitrogen fixation NifU-like protein
MNPRNVGEIEDASGVGEVGNPSCGDVMRFYLKIKDGVIEDIKFKTFGCGAAIATSSMATEIVKGKSIEEAVTVTNNVVADALGGLPAVKMHCSVLAEEALEEALKDYFKKQGEPEDQVIQLKKKAGIKIKEHHHDHDHDHDHE